MRCVMTTRLLICSVCILGLTAFAQSVCAQQQAPVSSAVLSSDSSQQPNSGQSPAQSGTTAADTTTPDSDPVTLFPHSESRRWYIGGEMNFIAQWHPSFPAK